MTDHEHRGNSIKIAKKKQKIAIQSLAGSTQCVSRSCERDSL